MSFIQKVGHLFNKMSDEAQTYNAEVQALMERYRDEECYGDDELKRILASTGFMAPERKAKIAAKKVLEERGHYFGR